FFGERRGPPSLAEGHSAKADSAGHGHGAHLHDAPPAMALALIVLAAGSMLAGFVGLPHVIGENKIERFLEPAFEAHATAPATEFQVIEGRPRLRPEGATAGQAGTGQTAGQTAAGHEGAAEPNEWLLMGL